MDIDWERQIGLRNTARETTYEQVRPRQPGVRVAVQSQCVYDRHQAEYPWLKDATPEFIVGHAFLVYDPARIPALNDYLIKRFPP